MYHIITRLLRNERIFTDCFSWNICIINPHNPYSLLLSTLFKLFFKYFAIILIHIKSPHYNIYPPPDKQVGGKKGIIIYFRIYFQLHCKWGKRQIYSNSTPRTPYYLAPFLLILSPIAAKIRKNVKVLKKLAANTVINNCIKSLLLFFILVMINPCGKYNIYDY